MGIDIIDIIKKEEFWDITYKKIILCYNEETDSEFYRVEWVDEIQDGSAWEDECEFNNFEDAEEFYYSLTEPKEYRSKFDEKGFRWEEVKWKHY